MKKVIPKPPIIFIDLPRFLRDSDKKTQQILFCYPPEMLLCMSLTSEGQFYFFEI